MKNTLLIPILCGLLVFSCASGPRGLRNSKEIVDISSIDKEKEITRDNAEEILSQYSVEFELPNPLVDNYGARSSTFDPSHESTILCNAVLLDDFSTVADILSHCLEDSLDDAEYEEFRNNYTEEHIRPDMFRIRIEMESGFSSKSMDPKHWSIYLETAKGIMIEPAEITDSSVSAIDDSVFSNYYNRNFPRSLLKRDITLHFQKTTFFGENLFGSDNPFFVLVFSREKKTLTRISWKF